jgi:hypothetical protein
VTAREAAAGSRRLTSDLFQEDGVVEADMSLAADDE